MKLNINTSPLTDGNSGRGVGHYTRMLINAITTHTDVCLVDTTSEADVVHYPFFDLFFYILVQEALDTFLGCFFKFLRI